LRKHGVVLVLPRIDPAAFTLLLDASIEEVPKPAHAQELVLHPAV